MSLISFVFLVLFVVDYLLLCCESFAGLGSLMNSGKKNC